VPRASWALNRRATVPSGRLNLGTCRMQNFQDSESTYIQMGWRAVSRMQIYAGFRATAATHVAGRAARATQPRTWHHWYGVEYVHSARCNVVDVCSAGRLSLYRRCARVTVYASNRTRAHGRGVRRQEKRQAAPQAYKFTLFHNQDFRWWCLWAVVP
jgi:hypothetical protein